MFHLTTVPVLPDVVVLFLSSIVVLRAHGQFWIVPLLHSVSDIAVIFVVPEVSEIQGLIPRESVLFNDNVRRKSV
jgi:hypothetical protein